MLERTMTKPRTLSATTMIGNSVHNPQGEDLGNIEELMLDVPSGRIAYAVLSFGGILGFGEEYYAIPWQSLELDPERKTFTLDISKETLKDAPSFDKDDWPEAENYDWVGRVYAHYGVQPFW